MGEQRFCKDCQHYLGYMESSCLRPLTQELDIISGRPKRRLWASARRERKQGRTLFGRVRCGPDARFYEPNYLVLEREAVAASPSSKGQE